jgi:hypothetical protein
LAFDTLPVTGIFFSLDFLFKFTLGFLSLPWWPWELDFFIYLFIFLWLLEAIMVLTIFMNIGSFFLLARTDLGGLENDPLTIHIKG